jgi:tRNA-uridine 2-sulfurtransferase
LIFEIGADQEIYKKEKTSFNSLQEELAHEAASIPYVPEMGKVVGKHQGAHYFTKGQRKGLNVGGTVEPLFIIETDVENNIIYTGQGNHHPGLYKKALFVEGSEVHWIREDLALKNGESMEVMARIRYRQPLQKATLYQYEDGLYVAFEEAQSAITEGQFVSWHLGEELIGSGVIA